MISPTPKVLTEADLAGLPRAVSSPNDLPSVGTEDARRVSLPPLPLPYGHIHDQFGNRPLSFENGPIPEHRLLTCSTLGLYGVSQMLDYAHAAIAAVVSERDELASRVMDLEANARRYEWLRENNAYSIHDRLFADCPMHKFNDAMLDGAIDAAIASKEQP